MTLPTPMGQLDACGCCESDVSEPRIFNRPGLPAIDYRIGTHPTFLARMLAALPRAPYTDDVPPGPDPPRPLHGLTTRSPDDPSIALLDAWATVADVLTFYQERIANEGFLGTSVEVRSILELARAIGYELRPGVAASTYLAFSVETAAGAPESALVRQGTKVKSIPGQDQRPQTFETTAEITARGEWNAMRPVRSAPQPIARDLTELRLSGISTNLQKGDGILIVGNERMAYPGSERWDFRILTKVETFPPTDPTDPGLTIASWELGLGQDKNPTVDPSAEDPRVFALRRRASIFGYNAPDWRTMPGDVKLAFDSTWDKENPDLRKTQWPGFELPSSGDPIVDLDAYYPKILRDGWLVFAGPTYTELYRAVSVEPASQTDFGISSKTTRIGLDASEHLSWFDRRSTVVHTEAEELFMAGAADLAAVKGRTVTIDPLVTPPLQGQLLIFSGPEAGASPDAEDVREVAVVDQATVSPTKDPTETIIELVDDLRHCYDPRRLTISGNVAPATHGETVDREVLGGGDGTATFQRFALKKPPLTYVAAATPSGAASTLTLRVNDVEWGEASSLYGLGPRDQRYVLRNDDAQRTTLIFGDGVSGSRLPTGQENVVATYRSGLGPDGNLGADSLTLLQTRPLGIRAVSNPLAAEGGAPSESLDGARQNAPRTVLTLDRAVALQDYEDFARSFAGLAKAKATRIWTGARYAIHVTVAGSDGAVLSADSATLDELHDAIEAIRDPGAQLVIASYRPLAFLVDAQVMADARYEQAKVFADVSATLADLFSFERRDFAQDVTSAEVIAAIQGVTGVVATNLIGLAAFTPATPPATGSAVPLHEVLLAEEASLKGGAYDAAQLLLIDPTRTQIAEMQP